MFKASISDVSLLRDSLDTVSQLIGEGVFKLTDEGIKLSAADRAMVAVVDMQLKKEAFETYELDSDESIGVNIENLTQVLKRAKAKDTIHLELSEDKSKLHVKMVGDSTKKFSIPLLELQDSEVPDINKLDFGTIIELKTSALEDSIEDAFILSDSVVVEANDGILVMKTDGTSSTSESSLNKDSGIVSFEGGGARARYPLDYLKKMMKASKLSDVVSLKMGKDFPMKLQFTSPDRCVVTFVLAPRVEE